jgi:hypothetical protein
VSEHTDQHSERDDAEAERAGEQPDTGRESEPSAATSGRSGQASDPPEAARAGEYEQSGSLGTGTQGDSIAQEFAERERDSD